MSQVLSHIDSRSGLTFEWSGGPYIDIYAVGVEIPFEVINVYDYAAGKPSIPFTIDALEHEANEWLFATWDVEADNYYRNVIEFQYVY